MTDRSIGGLTAVPALSRLDLLAASPIEWLRPGTLHKRLLAAYGRHTAQKGLPVLGLFQSRRNVAGAEQLHAYALGGRSPVTIPPRSAFPLSTGSGYFFGASA